MTIVDSVTGWFELFQLKGKPDAFVCMKHFDFTWLACCPRPREIEFDNGVKFSAEFQSCATTWVLNSACCPPGIYSLMQSQKEATKY